MTSSQFPQNIKS
uniref:Uncharacterized protein n=1 Tax=Anguilla anguilla TaxID=7936 RepID=A0A0E9RHU9_ANGAN